MKYLYAGKIRKELFDQLEKLGSKFKGVGENKYNLGGYIKCVKEPLNGSLILISRKYYLSMELYSRNRYQSEEVHNWSLDITQSWIQAFVGSAYDSFVHVNDCCYPASICSWRNGYLCSHNNYDKIQSCILQEIFSKIEAY
jgi:hypothetical protein